MGLEQVGFKTTSFTGSTVKPSIGTELSKLVLATGSIADKITSQAVKDKENEELKNKRVSAEEEALRKKESKLAYLEMNKDRLKRENDFFSENPTPTSMQIEEFNKKVYDEQSSLRGILTEEDLFKYDAEYEGFRSKTLELRDKELRDIEKNWSIDMARSAKSMEDIDSILEMNDYGEVKKKELLSEYVDTIYKNILNNKEKIIGSRTTSKTLRENFDSLYKEIEDVKLKANVEKELKDIDDSIDKIVSEEKFVKGELSEYEIQNKKINKQKIIDDMFKKGGEDRKSAYALAHHNNTVISELELTADRLNSSMKNNFKSAVKNIGTLNEAIAEGYTFKNKNVEKNLASLDVLIKTGDYDLSTEDGISTLFYAYTENQKNSAKISRKQLVQFAEEEDMFDDYSQTEINSIIDTATEIAKTTGSIDESFKKAIEINNRYTFGETESSILGISFGRNVRASFLGTDVRTEEDYNRFIEAVESIHKFPIRSLTRYGDVFRIESSVKDENGEYTTVTINKNNVNNIIRDFNKNTLNVFNRNKDNKYGSSSSITTNAQVAYELKYGDKISLSNADLTKDYHRAITKVINEVYSNTKPDKYGYYSVSYQDINAIFDEEQYYRFVDKSKISMATKSVIGKEVDLVQQALGKFKFKKSKDGFVVDGLSAQFKPDSTNTDEDGNRVDALSGTPLKNISLFYKTTEVTEHSSNNKQSKDSKVATGRERRATKKNIDNMSFKSKVEKAKEYGLTYNQYISRGLYGVSNKDNLKIISEFLNNNKYDEVMELSDDDRFNLMVDILVDYDSSIFGWNYNGKDVELKSLSRGYTAIGKKSISKLNDSKFTDKLRKILLER